MNSVDNLATERALIAQLFPMLVAIGENKAKAFLDDGTILKQIDQVMEMDIERQNIWSDQKVANVMASNGGRLPMGQEFRLSVSYLSSTQLVRINQHLRWKTNTNTKKRIVKCYENIKRVVAELIRAPDTWTHINSLVYDLPSEDSRVDLTSDQTASVSPVDQTWWDGNAWYTPADSTSEATAAGALGSMVSDSFEDIAYAEAYGSFHEPGGKIVVIRGFKKVHQTSETPASVPVDENA
jgi:hypothetical protein